MVQQFQPLKITFKQVKIVKDIRLERAYKGTKYTELAQRYGVNELAIINAIKGKTWKRVDYYPQFPELKGGRNE